MSFIGKKLIIKNASWQDVAISNMVYRIDNTEFIIGQVRKLYVWFTDHIDNDVVVSSSDTSLAVVGTKTGIGTEGRPFTYDITAIDEGTPSISIISEGITKTILLNIQEGDVPSGYIQYKAIHVDANGDETVRCAVDDIKLSPNYSYEINIKNGGTADNQALFGVRGYTKTDETYDNTGKSFALFANATTGTPTGAKLGFWWNNVDSNPIFNALPPDDEMYTIIVQPTTNGATFTSSYNSAAISVNNSVSVSEWATGFAFFNYMQGNRTFGTVGCKNCSIGNTKIKDAFGTLIYEFIPVKDPNNKYGYYEKFTGKFYAFNENTTKYNSISGETS